MKVIYEKFSEMLEKVQEIIAARNPMSETPYPG